MQDESKSMNDFTLFLGGMPVIRGKIELTRNEQPAEEPGPEGVMPLAGAEITLNIRAPKRWRCRSRKRFVKLMMSEGVSRNSAEWLADFVRGWMPYGEAWMTHLLGDLGEGGGGHAGRETAHGSGGGKGEKAPVQG